MSNVSFVSTFNFVGETPDNSDVVPSIAFAGAFAAAALALIVRKIASGFYFPLLWALIFAATRVGAFIVRYMWAKTDLSQVDTIKNLATVELILLSAGLVFLFESLFGFLSSLSKRSKRSHYIIHPCIVFILEFTPRAASFLGVTGAFKQIQAKTQQDIDDAKPFRNISLYLFMATAIIIYALAIMYACISDLRRNVRSIGIRIFAILFINTLLVVEVVYRLAQIGSSSPSDSINNKTIFYIAMPAVEIVAVVLMIILPTKRWYKGSNDDLPVADYPQYPPKPQMMAPMPVAAYYNQRQAPYV